MKPIHVISIGSILALGLGAWFFLFSQEEIIDYPKEGAGENVMFFGDSLVEGVGASQGNDLPSQVSRRIGMPVINAGKSGDTAESAFVRLSEDVLSRDPRVVIVLLGGNDMLREIPVEQTVSNLEAIVQDIHATNAGVLLLGMPNLPLRGDYEGPIRELAKRERVSYVPNVMNGVIGKRELMADQIHPNDKGYEQMAERIAPVLLRMLQ